MIILLVIAGILFGIAAFDAHVGWHELGIAALVFAAVVHFGGLG